MSEALLIATYLGPMYMVFGLSMFLNKDFYIDFGKRFRKNPDGQLILAAIEIVIAVLILNFAWGWKSAPEAIVSIFGIGAAIEALFTLFATKTYTQLVVRFTSEKMIQYGAVVAFLLGAYLTWFAYAA